MYVFGVYNFVQRATEYELICEKMVGSCKAREEPDRKGLWVAGPVMGLLTPSGKIHQVGSRVGTARVGNRDVQFKAL